MSAAQGRIAAGECCACLCACICLCCACCPHQLIVSQASEPTSSDSMHRTGTRTPPPTWATWIRRCVCAACFQFCVSLARVLPHTLTALLACSQVFEEMIWELFTQAGPVGKCWVWCCVSDDQTSLSFLRALRTRGVPVRVHMHSRTVSLCRTSGARVVCMPACMCACKQTPLCAHTPSLLSPSLLPCSERVPPQGQGDQLPSGLRLCGVQGRGGCRLCEFGGVL